MAASNPIIGQRLGHYRILEQIGAGGMGVVFRARDERLERDVAIKILPPGALEDQNRRNRFRKEALALSRLNHPNIATVHDFDSQGGVDFLVTELVPGATLDAKLDKQVMAQKDIVQWGVQLADGLATAHGEGIIHRDLKPANLRVTPDGRLKILDFGLARVIAKPTDETVSQILTAGEEAVGTLPYISPEQLRGEKADARTDIWAAGATLYEMAAGRPPFAGKTSSALTDAILHEPPPAPSRLNPTLSTKLEEIILKCLDKNPEHRYQSAKELAVDLRRLALPEPVGPARLRRSLWERAAVIWTFVAILVTIIALLVGLNVGRWRDRLLGRAPSRRIESLAVLPLDTLSKDAEQEYFAEGMTDELITQLAQIGGLRVISRTSAMRYKGTGKSIRDIGRELSVDGIVEGTIFRSGQRVRISAQLVDAATDQHLWAESYERDLRDVFALQKDIAGGVARHIRAKLLPGEQSRLVSPPAYEAYLRGRHDLNAATSEADIERSIADFHSALAQDPQFALAYSGLALSYVALSDFYRAPNEVMPQAEEAARKALELDETLSEAHDALGYVAFIYRWNWPEAEQHLRRAIALNPGNALAHDHYANYFSSLARHAEALSSSQRARDLDPLSLLIQANSGAYLLFGRQYDRAIERERKALQLDPNCSTCRSYLALAYAQNRQFSESLREARLVRLPQANPLDVATVGSAVAAAGERAEAEGLLRRLQNLRKQRFVCPYEIATTYLALGEKNQALRELENAYQAHSICMIWLKVDPRLDPLRSDPRFQALVQRMAFPP